MLRETCYISFFYDPANEVREGPEVLKIILIRSSGHADFTCRKISVSVVETSLQTDAYHKATKME